MQNGTMHDMHTLVSALCMHIIIVTYVARKSQLLRDQEIALEEEACEHTRRIFVTLSAKGAVWGHVWVYHVPEFSRTWIPCFPLWGTMRRDAILHRTNELDWTMTVEWTRKKEELLYVHVREAHQAKKNPAFQYIIHTHTFFSINQTPIESCKRWVHATWGYQSQKMQKMFKRPHYFVLSFAYFLSYLLATTFFKFTQLLRKFALFCKLRSNLHKCGYGGH